MNLRTSVGVALANLYSSETALFDPRIFTALRFLRAKSRGGPGKRSVMALHRNGGLYRPHQNQRECARRIAQIAAGQIRFHTITPTGTDKGKGFSRAALRREARGQA